MRKHFADVTRANESDTQEYWSSTYCGIEYTESLLTNNWEEVDCKRCLKSRERMNHHGVEEGDQY